MTTLTEKELAVLKAIDMSEYGDNIMDAIWTWSVADNMDRDIIANDSSLGGIIASLTKKGFVWSCEDGEDSSIEFTEDGFNAYIAEVGRENINKWLDQSDLDAWEAKRAAKKAAKTSDGTNIETQRIQSQTPGGFPHGTNSHADMSFNIMSFCLQHNTKGSPRDARLYEPTIIWTGERYVNK